MAVSQLVRQRSGVGDAIVDEAVTDSPHHVMTGVHAGAMLHVDVIDVEIFAKGARNIPVRAIVVGLHRKIRLGGKWMRPFRHHIPTADDDVARARLGDSATVPIAQQTETVAAGRIPVETKSSLSRVPAVGGVLPIREQRGITTEGLAVDSILGVGAEPAAVASGSEAAQLVAA